MWTRAACLLIGALCLGQSAADRQPGVEIEDRLDLVPVDNRVLAIDSRRNRTIEITLEIDERVISAESRGLVGVVVTTARLLGVSTESSRFQELRYRVNERESAPPDVYLGDRVAVVALRRRLVGMSSTTTSWLSLDTGPREQIERVFAEANLVVAVSDRRAVVLAPNLTDFAEIDLTPKETLEDASLSENSITLITSRRILIFRAGSGSWSSFLRKNRAD